MALGPLDQVAEMVDPLLANCGVELVLQCVTPLIEGQGMIVETLGKLLAGVAGASVQDYRTDSDHTGASSKSQSDPGDH